MEIYSKQTYLHWKTTIKKLYLHWKITVKMLYLHWKFTKFSLKIILFTPEIYTDTRIYKSPPAFISVILTQSTMASKRTRLCNLSDISLNRASTPVESDSEEEETVLDNFSDFNPSDEGIPLLIATMKLLHVRHSLLRCGFHPQRVLFF